MPSAQPPKETAVRRAFPLTRREERQGACLLDKRSNNSISRKPLRIAMFGQKRIPSREGGVEVVVAELATRMVRLGHTVTCLNRSGSHVCGKEYGAAQRGTWEGVRLIPVPTLDKKGLAAASSSFFAAIRAAFGPYDVVHVHAEGPCAMLWLPRLLGKRCIATIHGLDHQRQKWGRFAKAYILLGERVAARWAHEIIVLSRDVEQYFLDTYGRETVFIPNGVNRPTHRPAEILREQYGLEPGEYILFMSRLVPEKGLEPLIRAFQQVNTTKTLVIAGGSSDTDAFAASLQEMAKDDPRILFTGYVEGPLLEELSSNCYFYVLPSYLEGMPMGLLEAMSYGCCCLTSDIPECTDVTCGHGPSFRVGDQEDLARSLQQLCDDPQLVERYRSGAADYICARHNWDDIVARTLALYRAPEGQA